MRLVFGCDEVAATKIEKDEAGGRRAGNRVKRFYIKNVKLIMRHY